MAVPFIGCCHDVLSLLLSRSVIGPAASSRERPARIGLPTAGLTINSQFSNVQRRDRFDAGESINRRRRSPHRNISRSVLDLVGFEVVGTACRVSDALAQAKQTSPEIAIFGVELAGKRDGIEGATLLREFLEILSSL